VNVIAKKTFEFEGKEYETRVEQHATRYTIAVFHQNMRVNPVTYSVDLDFGGQFDLKNRYEVDAYQYLMEIAEKDIREKVWEKYLEACSTRGKRSQEVRRHMTEPSK
jgi:hypothetical protein